MVKFEDFQKIELKIARVLEAEEIEDSDKLLRLVISLGEEKRQILAGIKGSYSSESLIGKEIVVVTNLEPRTIMGLQSQGMLLAAVCDSGAVLLIPEKEVPPGTGVS